MPIGKSISQLMDTHEESICNCLVPPHSTHSGDFEDSTLDSETAGMFFLTVLEAGRSMVKDFWCQNGWHFTGVSF